MRELADALLEAHVRHELTRWQESTLPEQLGRSVAELLAWFGEIKLDDVASAEQIMGVIDRYVIELRLSGGITELAGEMSRIVFVSQNSAQTRLSEVVDEADYERFAGKITALDGLRRELISIIARSEAIELATARVISRSVSDLLLSLGSQSKLAARLLPALERRVAAALARYFEGKRKYAGAKTEERLLDALDPECVRSIADEIWASVSSMPLTDAFLLISEQDLEDFVVLGYEFWQRYRKTPYFRRISQEVVEHFFAKYGQQSLHLLITDMGVDEQMVSHELVTFLGPLIGQALRSGFLERQIRARLEPFYRSEQVASLLEAR